MNRPFFQRILPDIFAFCAGLGLAWFLKWETTDLVWSLWLCSLGIGYMTLLSALGRGAYIGLHVIRHSNFKPEHHLPVILFGVFTGLFLMVFFSVHFGGFHAGHSVFLMHFFPVEGMPRDGFGAAFMNPLLLCRLVFRHILRPYSVFLVPALIAERKHVFLPLIRAAETVRNGIEPNDLKKVIAGDKNGKKGHFIGNAMGRPYVNVIRMHLLIFFFAFAHASGFDGFPVYAVVYAVYFFPWAELKHACRPVFR